MTARRERARRQRAGVVAPVGALEALQGGDLGVAGHDDGFANATLLRLSHDVVVVRCSSTVDRIVARPIHAASPRLRSTRRAGRHGDP